MNILKLFSLFLLVIAAIAIKNDEVARSPESLEKANNDEKASTEMKFYQEDDIDDMDEKVIPEDQKALSDASDESRLQKRNPLVCAARRAACWFACRRVPRFLRGACRRVCNFGLQHANRAVCYVACRNVHPLIRGICRWVCRCLR